VQKHRYDQATGELEVSVSGQLSTTGQKYSYEITFVVVLTDASAAKFTPVSTGCRGVEECAIPPRTLAGSIPAGMQFLGIGTRAWDIGSEDGALSLNALSSRVENATVAPPDVTLGCRGFFRDAAGG
jgi:hypothetical protein